VRRFATTSYFAATSNQRHGNSTIPAELRLSADEELVEGYCGENEKDRSHFVGKRSDGAFTVPVETLGRYAGVFAEALPNGRSRRVAFSMYDGELWATDEGKVASGPEISDRVRGIGVR
jgi:hypothetical protein